MNLILRYKKYYCGRILQWMNQVKQDTYPCYTKMNIFRGVFYLKWLKNLCAKWTFKGQIFSRDSSKQQRNLSDLQQEVVN